MNTFNKCFLAVAQLLVFETNFDFGKLSHFQEYLDSLITKFSTALSVDNVLDKHLEI